MEPNLWNDLIQKNNADSLNWSNHDYFTNLRDPT